MAAKAESTSKPNIPVIWGDDRGITNLSCYSNGMMGDRTPNIDRLADEGMMFTDSYDNLLPYLTGKEEKSLRQGSIYFDDDGDLVALRFDNWKVVFMEQRCARTLQLGAEPFVPLRVPKLIFAAQGLVGAFLQTFKDFPPRQKSASFAVDHAMEKMEAAMSGAGH